MHGTDLPSDARSRQDRAQCSLDGLSVGDAIGEQMFFRSIDTLPAGPWRYTDDTAMAAVMVRHLARNERIEQDRLALEFAEEYQRDPYRGYGAMAHWVLREIGEGVCWEEAAGSVFGGQGSMGNGGAMRVAPVGAYFADVPERAVEQAQASAQVTHAHAEGGAGAMAVAAATAWATWWQAHPRRGQGAEMIRFAIAWTPEGRTREKLRQALEFRVRIPLEEAVQVLGNGSTVLAQDTVPLAIWVAAGHLGDYEGAIRTISRAGGDADTNAAIVGGICVMSCGRDGIPARWLEQREAPRT